MKFLNFSLCAILLVCLFSFTSTESVWFIPAPSIESIRPMRPIASAFKNIGYEVTFVLPQEFVHLVDDLDVKIQLLTDKGQQDISSIFSAFDDLSNLCAPVRNLIGIPEFNKAKPTFFVIDWYCIHGIALAEYLKVPFVISLTSNVYEFNPVLHAFTLGTLFPVKPNSVQNLLNTLYSETSSFYEFLFTKYIINPIRKQFLLPDFENYFAFLRTQYIFIERPFGLDPLPSFTNYNVHFVEPMINRQRKIKLTKALVNWLHNKEDAILVNLNTDQMDKELLKLLIKGLTFLNVIWSGSENIESFGNSSNFIKGEDNTIVEVMALPSVKTLISHCDTHSIIQSFENGKPVICVPFTQEEIDNTIKVEKDSLGEIILSNYSFKGIEKLVKRVSHHENFLSKAQKMKTHLLSKSGHFQIVEYMQKSLSSSNLKKFSEKFQISPDTPTWYEKYLGEIAVIFVLFTIPFILSFMLIFCCATLLITPPKPKKMAPASASISSQSQKVKKPDNSTHSLSSRKKNPNPIKQPSKKK